MIPRVPDPPILHCRHEAQLKATPKDTGAKAPSQVRIIGGTLRGSKLPVLAAPGLRPTPDRARETLFNWLAPIIHGARVLDLFAGTGALGIEALSRGAGHCDFVESDPRVAASLRESLARLKQDATVWVQPAARVLAQLPGAYDVVFVDPPFAAEAWGSILAALEASGRLSGSAWIHVEAPEAQAFPVPPNWSPWREGRFGDVRLRLYRRMADSTIS